jgi:hypothetical protein
MRSASAVMAFLVLVGGSGGDENTWQITMHMAMPQENTSLKRP